MGRDEREVVMTREELREAAFGMFATAYPHEAATRDWARFVACMRTQKPEISEQEVRQVLSETEGHPRQIKSPPS